MFYVSAQGNLHVKQLVVKFCSFGRHSKSLKYGAQSDIARLLRRMLSWVIGCSSVASSSSINDDRLIISPDSVVPGVLYTIISLSFDESPVIAFHRFPVFHRIIKARKVTVQQVWLAVGILYLKIHCSYEVFRGFFYELLMYNKMEIVWVSHVNRKLCHYVDKQRLILTPVTCRLLQQCERSFVTSSELLLLAPP